MVLTPWINPFKMFWCPPHPFFCFKLWKFGTILRLRFKSVCELPFFIFLWYHPSLATICVIHKIVLCISSAFMNFYECDFHIFTTSTLFFTFNVPNFIRIWWTTLMSNFPIFRDVIKFLGFSYGQLRKKWHKIVTVKIQTNFSPSKVITYLQ